MNSRIASIRGEFLHLCEALEANNGRIDNTLNVPAFYKSEFEHWFIIRGFQWKVVYNGSIARSIRQVVPQPSQEAYSDSSLDNEGLASIVTYMGVVNFERIFEYKYVAAFGVKYRRELSDDKVSIGGLTVRNSVICLRIDFQSTLGGFQSNQ